MRSDEEIKKEIEALIAMKPYVQRWTMFHEDNHAKIDVAIKVLKEDMDEDEIDDQYADGPHSLYEEARNVREWLDGEDEMRPSGEDCWGGLAKRGGYTTQADQKPTKKPNKKGKK